MKRGILLSLACLCLAGCTDGNKARVILEKQGYKNVEITGYRMFTCGDNDDFSTGFKAISSSGVKVSGAVCSEFFKASTIRFD